MARYLTNEQVVALLKKTLGVGRHHTTWAQAHGIPESTISLILTGHREVSPSVASALGYEKRTVYVKKEQ